MCQESPGWARLVLKSSCHLILIGKKVRNARGWNHMCMSKFTVSLSFILSKISSAICYHVIKNGWSWCCLNILPADKLLYWAHGQKSWLNEGCANPSESETLSPSQHVENDDIPVFNKEFWFFTAPPPQKNYSFYKVRWGHKAQSMLKMNYYMTEKHLRGSATMSLLTSPICHSRRLDSKLRPSLFWLKVSLVSFPLFTDWMPRVDTNRSTICNSWI